MIRRDTSTADAPTERSNAGRMARVCRFAFTITLMTAALGGIIALKTSIYLARFSY
jgi:hypothetical protein